MNILNIMIKPLRLYATLEGRASRKEFWLFFLLMFIVCGGLFVLTSILMLPGILMYLSALLVLSSIAVTVRRLHDTNRSGWMYLLFLIPLIGIIWLLVLMLLKSSDGHNKYGKPCCS